LEPEKESSLVDLVDRLLTKGVVLNADLVITVAGIPMIGLNLRAALASIETMLDYGMMEAWDRDTREWYTREFCESRLSLEEGESVLFKGFGYLWKDDGIIRSWVPGLWHITDRRVMLWRREPAEVLFESPLSDVESLIERREESFFGGRAELDLVHRGIKSRMYISDIRDFIIALERAAAKRLLIKSEAIV
jgi:hypothetical protein